MRFPATKTSVSFPAVRVEAVMDSILCQVYCKVEKSKAKIKGFILYAA